MKPLFTIIPEFKIAYHDMIEAGYKHLKNKNIFITGLVRNGETMLYDNIKRLNLLQQHCKQLNYFIYENDSRDQTPEILKKLSSELSGFNFRSEKLSLKGFAAIKDSERTTNLAIHRNRCKDFIQDYEGKIDYIIVTDLDFSSISIDGILNSFGWLSKKECDAIAGFSFQLKPIFDPVNNVPWNYDCWAYRGSWWDDIQKFSNSYCYDPMVWFGLWHPPVGSKPIKVNSAFGGMTIYKTKHFLSADYEGYDCEHVCFHKNIVAKNSKFRLAMNPSQIMVF